MHGHLTVPAGVELRGVYDVPHHTLGRGSVLRIYAGRNDGNAAPFIVMERNSGLRGLTFFYPEQKCDAIVPYPFMVQGRGENIYVINITAMNPYRMLDFKSFRCDNHRINYPSGAPLKAGVVVGGGSAGGEVYNTQFNSHYWNRSPFPDCPGRLKGGTERRINLVWNFQHENLDAFVFGDCRNERQYQNAVFGSCRGLYFVSENGRGASGLVLGHGSDGTRISMAFDGLGPDGMDVINSQLVSMNSTDPHPAPDKRYLQCGERLNSAARLYNTTFWGQPVNSLTVHGGSLLIELASFFQYAPFVVDGGKMELINTYLGNNVANDSNLILRNGGRASLVGILSPWGMRLNSDAPPSAMTAQFQNQRNSPLPGAKEISVTLGKTQKRLGLSLREHSVESENVPVTRGGRAAWASARHPPQAPDSYMMYWLVKFPEFRNGGAPKVTISVEYFDEGTGDFRICYDSSDRSVKALPHAPGAWKRPRYSN